MIRAWRKYGRLSQERLKLSVILNTADGVDQIKACPGEIISKQIDKSTMMFVPFYTNFGQHIQLGENVFINHACTFLDLGGINIEDDVQIGPK